MTPSTRLTLGLLAAVVVVEGILVAGAFNPAPHAGGDNAGYVSLAHALLTTGSYTEAFDPAGLPHTKYPPLFPALLAALIALGARTWVALKSTAAVATVTAVALTYLWAARRVGPWSALAVALLFGASSAVVYYSHWVLSDPVFVALTMAALWALDRELAGNAASGEAEGSDGDARAGRWLAVGVVAAGLAYFTRSAGLPLVVAMLGWLAWRRRWRSLAWAGAALGAPALVWWMRGRGAPGSYATELWMVDPYQPALGTIGPVGLLPRAFENLSGYVLGHGPEGIVGARGAWVSLLGVVLVAAALYGWVRAVRRGRVGPAELFLPLYAGLVLLWPTVWSGDRFALPLYPLVFLYGALALRDVAARLPRFVGNLLAAAVVLAVALPAAASWVREARTARTCARVVAAEGAFACYGPRVGAFVTAAEWAATGLPDGAAILTRKPRIFYALSGVPSRTFPFDEDPAVLLAVADEVGAAYVLLDEWDDLAGAYVGGAVARRPGAFCYMRSFGTPGAGGAQLLGILTHESRLGASAGSAGEVRIDRCPALYTAAEEPVHQSSSSSGRIPLLEGLDP
jgi:4-amino-4-deoxy-L-arabinose transferase-like glycosyltransferase